MPAIVGAYILGQALATSFGVAMVAQYAVGYLVTTLATSAILGALSPKPSTANSARGYQTNTSGTALDHQIVYGEVKVGGAILYDETTGSDNKFLHRIIGVAGHEIQSFERIYINDEYIDVSSIPASGNVPLVYSSDGQATSDRYNGKVTINFHLGSPNQAADADLVAASTRWTSQHRLRGIAYMYIKMEYDQDTFPNGIPIFTATIKGKKVKNPATGLTTWSDNPALCLRDYLTSTGYGLAEDEDNIDDALVNTAASVCNQTNTDAGTKRFTCNGSFTTGSTPYDTISNLLTSMGGTMWYAQGKWRMKPAYWTASVMDLNEDDLRSSISVSTRHSRRDNFNTVKGTFRGEESNWQVTDYPERTLQAFIDADGGQESVADINLSFTDTSVEARRLALITLERNRQQLTISASFNLRTLGLQVGDNVRVTNSRFGWVNKYFEVVSWNFGLTDGLDLQTDVVLRETASSVFDEVADGIAYERDNTNLPSPFNGLGLTNLAVNGGGRTQGDGTFVNSAIFSWDAADSAFVSYYKITWKPLADSNYASTTTTGTSIELSPIVDAVEYVFRVQSISVLGNGGSISSITYTVGGDISAPNAPTSLSATGSFKYITVKWTNPSANDFNYVEVWENSINSTVGATQIAVSSGNSFIRSNLNIDQTRYYFLKSVDYTGNKSGFTSGVSGTTTGLEDADFSNGIYSLFTDQGLYAIKDVTSLPPSGTFTGEKVFNRTDGKLYQWTGTAWVLVVADVADGSITGVKIGTDAITAPKILGGTITGDKIFANTITGGLLATSGIITTNAQIGNAVIKNANIENLAVSTLKIQDQAVTFTSFLRINSIYNVSSTTAWTNVADIVVPRTALIPGMVVGLFTASHSTSGGSTVSRSDWIEFDAEVVLVTGSTISTLSSITSIRVDGFNTTGMNVTAVVSHTSSGDQRYRLRIKKTGGSAANAVIVTPSLEVTELKK